MKTIKIIIIASTLSLILASCQKMEDYNLTSTIFIEDSYFPGLPIYSEWGYNTFGAYIDRKPFVSTYYELPAKIFVNTDTLHLILRGQMGYDNVDLKFSIKGYSPATYSELTELDGHIINLKESGRAVTLKVGNVTTELNLIEGEIEFKRIQRTIVSGYFNLKTFLNNEPIAISYGRFDLGIGYENFYNF